ncbi:natural killer cell receptor 2B4-like isoform X2 [Carassius carassius]|uniref:natural killer cell receptor 2B4-like isoform X2 n=1 Tax=Carassius carassius TaxID=217509 RepID=UPI002869129C|nr:natural killer cell receptor 2B4-like isoform X2 [Carassius carassius]
MEFKLLLTLVLSTHITGFSAEIPVFVQTGASVQLDIQTQQLPEFEDLYWTKYKYENIVKYINESKKVNLYKDRVDFNDTTFSLTLKNMQKTDSGPYRARTIGKSEKDIITYRVSVIDAVEAPVLTVNSKWSSHESCNFTCNGSNITVSFIYNRSSCSPEEVTSSDHYTLRLSCSGDSIMCNYSNPVSWKTDRVNVNEHCTVNEGKQASSVFPLWVVAIIFLFSLAAVISLCIYKRKKGALEVEQTIYAEVDENIKPRKSLEMLGKSENSQTVYDTVGDPGRTDATIHTQPVKQSSSLSDKSKSDAPVTIYCSIQQQANPPKTEAENTVYAVVSIPPADYESAHPQSE